MQIHNSSDRQGTWAENTTDGWYLQTSPEHYRCHKIHVKKTNSKRVSDTVFFKHKYITQPILTLADIITKAIDDLTHALKGNRNTKGMKEMETLQRQATQSSPTSTNTTAQASPQRRSSNSKGGQPIRQANSKGGQPKQHANSKGGSIHSQQKGERNVTRKSQNAPTHTPSTISRARIPQQHQMNLCQSQHNKRAQLIHDKETGEFPNYRKLLQDPKHKETWEKSAASKFRRLAQGLKNGRVKGTNTIFFIRKVKVPKYRAKDVTYGSFRCNLKPNKTEIHHTRLTAGGDRVDYPGNADTPTADMTLFKILMNSIISTKGARCIVLDIKDFCLCKPMTRFEYMRLKITDIPKEIITEYGLQKLAINGYVHCEIQKGMYNLPQSGIIAQELLEK